MVPTAVAHIGKPGWCDVAVASTLSPRSPTTIWERLFRPCSTVSAWGLGEYLLADLSDVANQPVYATTRSNTYSWLHAHATKSARRDTDGVVFPLKARSAESSLPPWGVERELNHHNPHEPLPEGHHAVEDTFVPDGEGYTNGVTNEPAPCTSRRA